MLADLLPDGHPVVSLATVLGQAPALTRVDRKYVVPVGVARTFLAELSTDWAVLDIDGRRTTHYRSTYFDTPGLATVHSHVQRRRRRWKARSRMYVEDRLCRLEVKARTGRGETVKAITEASPESYGRLSLPDRAFVARTLAGHGVRIDASVLQPTIEISYERMTLARTGEDPARMTLDWGVTCRLGRDHVRIDERHLLVETKGGLRPTDADRQLVGLGVRPRSFSKYAASASLLRSDIPDNDVRRLRGHVLHVAVDQPIDQPIRSIRSHVS